MRNQVYRGGWQRSSRCATSSCIEVTDDSHRIYIRDSKEMEGPLLEVSHDAWRAFVQFVKDGLHH